MLRRIGSDEDKLSQVDSSPTASTNFQNRRSSA